MHPLINIWPLTEAAKKANRKPSDLLRAGTRGDIKLLIGIPDGIGLRLLKDNTAQREIGEAHLMRTPNMLLLRPQHCSSLERTGGALVSDAPLGYGFDSRLGIKAFHPAECDAELPIVEASKVPWTDPRRRWTAWSLCKGGSDYELAVYSERVLVANTEIERYCDASRIERVNVPEHEFKSDYLQYMNLAASIFWGNKDVVKEDRLTHPKTETIVAWLEERDFSPSLAKKAASLLRPEFAGTGRLPEDLKAPD